MIDESGLKSVLLNYFTDDLLILLSILRDRSDEPRECQALATVCIRLCEEIKAAAENIFDEE